MNGDKLFFLGVDIGTGKVNSDIHEEVNLEAVSSAKITMYKS